MNITELIQKLETVKKEHDELQVMGYDRRWESMFPISRVDVEESLSGRHIEERGGPKCVCLD